MPHVDIKCYAGRTYAQKKMLAAKITRDIAEIFETSEDSVSIAIHVKMTWRVVVLRVFQRLS